jgi:secondary thiamine-phosphate synthase enzyme
MNGRGSHADAEHASGLNSMHQFQHIVEVPTRGAGLTEITGELEAFVVGSGVGTGLVTAFCRHTSCSLLIQENADPDVQRDLLTFFRKLVPEGMDWVVHDAEGPDDMPAHIKSALTQVSVGIPVSGGRAVLGTWQGLYLFEHRARPHRRQVVLHLIGE